jgi:signal transduction histidine kinase/FixJ family two-component response regulator
MKSEFKPLKLILEKQYFKYILYLTLSAFVASVFTVFISLHLERLQNCQSLANRVVYLNDVFAREIIIGSPETFSFELNKLKNDYFLDNIRFEKNSLKSNMTCSYTSLNNIVHLPIRFANNVLGHIVSTQGPIQVFKLSNLASFVPLLLIIGFSFIFLTSLTRIFQQYFFVPLTKMLKDAEQAGLNKQNFKYDGDVEEFEHLKNQLNSMLFRINEMNETNLKLEKAAGVGEVASQVAHDIRSPLEVLKSIDTDLQFLPIDSKRRILLSISRIEEIAYNLLKTHKQSLTSNKEIQSEELLGLLKSVILEKKIEFRNRASVEIIEDFDSNSYGLSSIIQRNTLKNIVSNLVNNGIDSFEGSPGNIKISINLHDHFNVITFIDNGNGINPTIREKLFTKGFTTKKTGNGLGLFNAKQDIEAVGGTIVCESEVGKGTTFTISLPKSEASATFIGSIDAYKYERIIVLDDDPAFHEVWAKRLQGLESKVEHIHSVEEMLSKYQALHPKILLLSDFELMDKHLDGIDTILKLGHSEYSVLVTARNEEKAIQDRCLAAGIKLLPKSLVNYVKVVKENSASFKVGSSGAGLQLTSEDQDTKAQTSIVLIDDDRLIHLNWNSYCKNNGFQFHGFKSIAQFIAFSTGIDKGSKIYIDSNLGDGIKGEIESEKIFALGFLNLYLATGYEKGSIQKPAWIKEIYSKSPENIS